MPVSLCLKIYDFSVVSNLTHKYLKSFYKTINFGQASKKLDYFSTLLNKASFVKNIYAEILKKALYFNGKQDLA